MTPQQLVGLGIRLFAIWLAIKSVQYFVAIPAALHDANIDDKSGQAYLIAGIYTFVAMLLWFFPMWIAHKLLPRTRFENAINLQSLEAARVGCALLGLWFSANGVIGLVWYLFRSFLVIGGQSAFESLGPDAKLDFIVTFASIVIGLFLIFRAGAFAALVVRDRASTGERT